MSNTITRLHWFPRSPNHFITWGSEINVYEVKNADHIDQSVATNINLELSATTSSVLLASETRYQYIRSVAPSFHTNGDLQLAVGLASGKVALCNFVPLTENNIEYTPRQSRPCLCLAWNEIEPNLLAMGHDRNRSDHCITVWDTERGAPKESSILCLIGLSETANSICWDKQNRILLAGMSHKCIKIMDLRLSNMQIPATNTRAVNGLSIAPNGRYMASYIDNIVGLWDIRNIDKPISQLQMQKNITALSWCPTRASMLATLQRDSPFIHLLDLHWPGSELDGEPHSMKRNVAPFLSKTGSSNRNTAIEDISWHPDDLERLLALSSSGSICDFKIPRRIAICWNNHNVLWGSVGTELSRIESPTPPSSPTESLNPWDTPVERYTGDISELMLKRAFDEYGQMTDIQKNGELAQNQTLKQVWHLLAHMNREDSMIGLKTILRVITNGQQDNSPPISASGFVHMTWSDFPASGSVKVYQSNQRERAHHLCGWTFDKYKESSISNFIDDLCNRHEYTRAAAIAVFNLKIRCAIEVLGRGAEKSLDPSSMRIAAIALSGFNQDKNGIWRSQCIVALNQITDSHLRAIFAFLTSDTEGYESVLNENGVSLCDRMAFSTMFLSDTKLAEYVRTMIQGCTERGDLNGLLLTGATEEGVNLLQSYLDWTEDVQTVSLIAARFFGQELLKEYRVQYWISSYRDLLDTWGLWEQRAQLDITMGNFRSPSKISKSVFLLCSFCGKSVSAALQEEARIRSNASNNKLSSCPNCRKPLPRCSLCLLHMGTISGITTQTENSGNSSGGWQSRPFSKWFSWCQTCRHGGHTEHLAQWFKEHIECPVTSCSCKCFAMDLQTPQFSREVL